MPDGGFELPRLRPEPPAPRPKRTLPAGMTPGGNPGAVNRITRDLKAGILNGAIAHGADGEGLGGLDGYLQMCAARFPKHYMHLLGKLLPLTLDADVNKTVVGVVNVVSIRSDNYMTREAIAKLAPVFEIEDAQVATEQAEIVQTADEDLDPIEPGEPVETEQPTGAMRVVRANRR